MFLWLYIINNQAVIFMCGILDDQTPLITRHTAGLYHIREDHGMSVCCFLSTVSQFQRVAMISV